MSLDLSGDWKLVDDTEAVTFFLKTGQGTYAAGVSVANAYREEMRRGDLWAIELGLLKDQSTFWHLWAAQLAGAVPVLNARVTDASSVNWTVRGVEDLDRDANGVQRYRLACTREITL